MHDPIFKCVWQRYFGTSLQLWPRQKRKLHKSSDLYCAVCEFAQVVIKVEIIN